MKFLPIYFIFFGISLVNGLTCYVCRGTSPTDSCIKDNGIEIGCLFKFCTIYRQERLDPPGELVAFLRQCEDTPTYLNVEVNTSTFREYYTACKTDRCNTGDGKLAPGSIKPIVEDAGNIIVVPGIGFNNSASLCFSDFLRLLYILGLYIFSTIIIQ